MREKRNRRNIRAGVPQKLGKGLFYGDLNRRMGVTICQTTFLVGWKFNDSSRYSPPRGYLLRIYRHLVCGSIIVSPSPWFVYLYIVYIPFLHPPLSAMCHNIWGVEVLLLHEDNP